MVNFFKKIQLETKKQFEVIDITDHVKSAILECKIKDGLVTVFSPHTTAAIRLNHNEPLLIQDIMKTLYRLVPVDISYSHDLFEVRQNVAPNERSNGHAHVKAFLLGSSESLPIEKSTLMLGGKQSIFFIELDGGRAREVYIKIIGESGLAAPAVPHVPAKIPVPQDHTTIPTSLAKILKSNHPS